MLTNFTHLRRSEDFQSKSVTAKGFTLIELLVVIIILGVLAAVVIIAVGQISGRGQDEACETERKTVSAAVALYFDDTGNYPASTATLVPTYLQDNPDNSFTINGTTGAVSACP